MNRSHTYTHTGPGLPSAADHAGVHREMVNGARTKPRHSGENYGGQLHAGPDKSHAQPMPEKLRESLNFNDEPMITGD